VISLVHYCLTNCHLPLSPTLGEQPDFSASDHDKQVNSRTWIRIEVMCIFLNVRILMNACLQIHEYMRTETDQKSFINIKLQCGWIRLCSHCCRGCHFIFVYVQRTLKIKWHPLQQWLHKRIHPVSRANNWEEMYTLNCMQWHLIFQIN